MTISRHGRSRAVFSACIERADAVPVREETIEVEGEVVEALPNTMFI